MPDMARWSVVWRNPYTSPIGPRGLGAVVVPHGTPCPPNLAALHAPGDGFFNRRVGVKLFCVFSQGRTRLVHRPQSAQSGRSVYGLHAQPMPLKSLIGVSDS